MNAGMRLIPSLIRSVRDASQARGVKPSLSETSYDQTSV